MKVLVIGCVHGRWDIVCSLIAQHSPNLCILTGDLQTFTNEEEMRASGMKTKYQQIGSFGLLLNGQL